MGSGWQARGSYRPGDFFVFVGEKCVLVIDDSTASDPTLLQQLCAHVEAGRVDNVGEAMSTAATTFPGGIALFQPLGAEAQIAFYGFGSMEVVVETPRSLTAIRPHEHQLESLSFRSDVLTMSIRRAGAEISTEPLVAHTSPPERAGEIVIALDAPMRLARERVEPAQVMGLRCPLEHHNHPKATFCVICGRKIRTTAPDQLTVGPRPKLGLLLLDGVVPFALDENLIVGRDPDRRQVGIMENARPIAIADPELGVSRCHFGLILKDWGVSVIDWNSSNGTYVRRRDQDEWTKLEPEEPISVEHGDSVRAGQREFLLQLHHGLE